MTFRRKVDLWLFENDVGRGDGYTGRWAIHAFARAGYGSRPTSYDLLVISDDRETAVFDEHFNTVGKFVNRCVVLLGDIGVLISTGDVERINGFWNDLQGRLND